MSFLSIVIATCCNCTIAWLQALVLKGLIGLCTVLYKSFPTSIQADKALLAGFQQQQQQFQQQQPPPSSSAVKVEDSNSECDPLAGSSSGIQKKDSLHSVATSRSVGTCTGLAGGPSRAEEALPGERLRIAISFRLAMKMRLEASAKLLLLRLKEL
jgi:hypothetical protein